MPLGKEGQAWRNGQTASVTSRKGLPLRAFLLALDGMLRQVRKVEPFPGNQAPPTMIYGINQDHLETESPWNHKTYLCPIRVLSFLDHLLHIFRLCYSQFPDLFSNHNYYMLLYAGDFY